MPQLLFVLAAVAHLYMLFRLVRLRTRGPEAIIAVLLLAMTMDNLILALSDVALGSPAYEKLNWLRYAAHVVILPFIIQAARLIAVRAGVPWADNRSIVIGSWILVVAGIAYGISTELVGLQFVEKELLDHVRLVSADAHPPLATIFANVVVLVFGAAIWRSSGWPWLFLAALQILLVNGGSAGNEYAVLLGNTAEVVFALGWVVTLHRFPADA